MFTNILIVILLASMNTTPMVVSMLLIPHVLIPYSDLLLQHVQLYIYNIIVNRWCGIDCVSVYFIAMAIKYY